jgi:hypothetical protein
MLSIGLHYIKLWGACYRGKTAAIIHRISRGERRYSKAVPVRGQFEKQ